jgi:carbon-monoxide dehydrogenase medium subunit
MIPASFDYYRASSVDDAVRLLGAHEDAKLVAGGHSLIPLMKLRLASPAALVDIGGLRELSGIREDGGEIVIGALTRHYALETSELLRSRAQVVSEAAAQIGDVQVRNRGTIAELGPLTSSSRCSQPTYSPTRSSRRFDSRHFPSGLAARM